jgi:hypothetical protein
MTLKELVSYDPETGIFTRLVRTSNKVKVGDVVGARNSHGYLFVNVCGKRYAAHRLAWYYVHGQWPDADIDHINGNKADNRIVNLRAATRSQNCANTPVRRNSKSGLKGVRWQEHAGKWKAQIKDRDGSRHLGYFDSKEAAHAAYVEAAGRLFGEFARAA